MSTRRTTTGDASSSAAASPAGERGQPRWLTADERTAWVRLLAVTELLPGVLDSQLRRDAQWTPFEYFVLALLSEDRKSVVKGMSVSVRVDLGGRRTIKTNQTTNTTH